jgi:hypothetical protein
MPANTETAYYDAHADWSLIPDYMRHGIEAYVMHGVPPGGFLTALFANDLMGALGKADDTNIGRIKDYGTFLYNFTPSGCHGSREVVGKWIDSGGLIGLRSAQAA